MRQGLEGEGGRLPHRSDHDVVGLVNAVRDVVLREVRNCQEKGSELVIGCLRLAVQRLDAVADPSHLLDELGRFRVHRGQALADLFPPRPELVCLVHPGTPARIDLQDAVDGDIFAPALRGPADPVRVVA